MAERTQYQYTPLVGPVWSEPVAEKLAWLPSGQQPARGLPPNRLGDFARPEFEALYKPAGLEWTPSGQQPARTLLPNKLGDFARPEFQALYKSERLEWIPSDRYAGRPLARALVDWSVFQGEPIAAVVPPIVVSVPETPFSGGAKSRKKIRGPYSDPRIYEAYIARCIAERAKPRVNVEVALLKEALIDEVEERRETEYDEYDALTRENQLLERLLTFERTKRNLAAIAARQRQISVQIEELMEQEAQSIIMLLNDM